MTMLLLLTALIGISAYAAPPAPSGAPSVAPSAVASLVTDPLKTAVMNSQSQLGVLDPAQKRIFDEEVVPQYPLFVKDYKSVGQVVNAEVDLEGVRNTIRFSAPKTLNQPAPKILLFLDADSRCPKCLEDAVEIKRSMQLRVERRGFTAAWLTAEELSGSAIADMVGPRGAVGFMQVTAIPAPQDDVDSAHADEKRFIAKTELSIRTIANYQDQAELFDTGSFETEVRKLLTHAFIELGAKSDLAGMSTASKDDLLVQLSGISGFTQYTRLKTNIQARLKGVALVDERRIARGQVVFALKTKKSVDEVKTLLNGVASGDDKAIQMEIHP